LFTPACAKAAPCQFVKRTKVPAEGVIERLLKESSLLAVAVARAEAGCTKLRLTAVRSTVHAEKDLFIYDAWVTGRFRAYCKRLLRQWFKAYGY
jgi:hypothetical protein